MSMLFLMNSPSLVSQFVVTFLGIGHFNNTIWNIWDPYKEYDFVYLNGQKSSIGVFKNSRLLLPKFHFLKVYIPIQSSSLELVFDDFAAIVTFSMQ